MYWVGHRSPAKRICVGFWEQVRPDERAGSKEKGSQWPTQINKCSFIWYGPAFCRFAVLRFAVLRFCGSLSQRWTNILQELVCKLSSCLFQHWNKHPQYVASSLFVYFNVEIKSTENTICWKICCVLPSPRSSKQGDRGRGGMKTSRVFEGGTLSPFREQSPAWPHCRAVLAARSIRSVFYKPKPARTIITKIWIINMNTNTNTNNNNNNNDHNNNNNNKCAQKLMC